MRATISVLDQIHTEFNKATAAHGPMKSRHEAYAVILEEVDEFWDEVKLNPAKMDAQTLLNWKVRMKKELVQVAAMAVRAILDLGLEPQEET